MRCYLSCGLLLAGSTVAHTELVSFGIVHDDPSTPMFGLNAVANAPATQLFQSARETFDIRHLDIQVHPVLAGLFLTDSLKQQLWPGWGSGHENDVVPN